MGAENAATNDKVIERDKEVKKRGKTVNIDSDTSDTATEAGAGTGPGTGPGTGNKAEEKEKGSKLALLNNEDEKPKQLKPKKVRKTKKTSIDYKSINSLLTPLFGMISSRKGCEHWAVSEEELTTISKPLANILNKYDFVEKFAEHSDALSLITACGVVFVPRMMITVEQNKAKKILTEGVRKNVGKPRENKPSDNTEKGTSNTFGDVKQSNRQPAPFLFGNNKDTGLFGSIIPD